MRHPLQEADYHFCVRVKHNLSNIAEEMSRKRKTTQAKYQMTRKAKIRQRMFAAVGNANTGANSIASDKST